MLRPVLRWSLLQNTKCKAIFETVPILKRKIRLYSQDGVNVRTMLLNKNNSRYKITFEVFSQTICNGQRIVCQEGSRERKNTEARTIATLSTATDPALPPGRMLQQWRLQISKTEVRWPVKGQGERLYLSRSNCKRNNSIFKGHYKLQHLLFLKGTEVLQ